MNAESRKTVIASAVVPNGRFGDHRISVERTDGCVLYLNGWSDPLLCDGEEQAMRLFNDKTSHKGSDK